MGMRLNVHGNVEVTVGTSLKTSIPLACVSQAHSVIEAGWDFHVESSFDGNTPVAFALRAFVKDPLTLTVTIGTRGTD
jgi:hypothetical protein